MVLILAYAVPIGLLKGSTGQIQPAATISAGGSEWGEPVEGLSVRLETQKAVWDDHETGRAGPSFAVMFRASVRNRGSATVMVAPVEEMGELEMDGVWHWWAEPVQVKSSPLAPDKELDGIVVIPDNRWLRTTPVLAASPGKHTFRFAVVARREASNGGPEIRAISNPIEVEYLASPRQVAGEIVGVWFSGHVVNDATGELMTNFLLQTGVLDPRRSAEVIWSDGPMQPPNFIGGQWSRNPELGGFWGAQNLADTNQQAWARIVAGGYVTQTVSPEPVTGYADIHDLTVRMKRGGELTGMVLAHSGQPVPGAKVILVDVQKLRVRDGVTGWWFGGLGDQFQNGVDTADASGRFTLSGDLKAAQAVVAVSADARMVWAVANNGATNGVKIQMPEPATINVRFDIPGDAPEAQLRFDLMCDEMNPDFRKAVRMDSFTAKVANAGQIAFTNLTPGAYSFERLKMLSIGDPTVDPNSNAGRAANRGRSILCEQRTIIVQPGEVTQVDLTRDTGYAISGKVTGLEATGALGAFIFVRPAGETNDSRDPIPGATRNCLDALTCGKDGAFQTPRLKPGTYSLVAEVESLTIATPANPPTQAAQRDPGYTGSAQVTIPGDGPPAPIQIALRRRVVVTPGSELLSQLFPSDHATNQAPGEAAAPSRNPKPTPSDPDNPLNLSDDTITKLFNTGKAMAIVASLSKMDFAWNRQTPNSVQALEGVIRGAQGSGADPFGGGDLRVGVSDGKVRIFSVGPDGKWDGGKLARSYDSQLLGDLGAESDLNVDLPHRIKWLNDDPLAQYLTGERTAHVLAKHGPHSAPPPPPDGKVNYGPPVDGLSAALELEISNGEVMAGETIGARFYIRNTADYDIQVRSPYWREGDDASVVDEAGRPIKTRDISGNPDLTVQRKTLKPGEVLTVDSRGLVFVLAESDDDQTNYPGDYSALVTPGKYTVKFALRFGDAVTAAWIPYITPGQPPPLANLPEPLDWQGTLRTGPVTVKVNARMRPRPGSRPNMLPDPANPLHLPPPLVSKLFQMGSVMWKVAGASQQYFFRHQHPPATLEDLNAPLPFLQQGRSSTPPPPLLAKNECGDLFGDGDLRIEASGHKLRIYSVGPEGKWENAKLARADDPNLAGALCVEADFLDSDAASYGPRLTSPNGDLLGFYFDGQRAHYLARERTDPGAKPAAKNGGENVPTAISSNRPALNYGPPVEGLRAAIEFVLTNGDVADGEPLRVRVHVRNEGEREALISSSWNWPSRQDVLDVEDQSGGKVDWKPGRLDELNAPNDVRSQAIRPGQDIVIKSGWVVPELPKAIWDLVMSGETLSPQAAPAKYTMRATFQLPDGPNRVPLQSAAWQGELKTGPATVKVELVMGVEISLGIRDNTRIGRFSNMQLVEYPLAFRVKNTGKRTIGQDNEPGLFMSGVVHIWPRGGKEDQRPLTQMWNGAVQDLPPGAEREYGLYADPVGFFRNLNDGDYRIWWTLGALKSNSLRFILKDGKATLEANDPNAPAIPAPSPPDSGSNGLLR
jgi:hypothetical protein